MTIFSYVIMQDFFAYCVPMTFDGNFRSLQSIESVKYCHCTNQYYDCTPAKTSLISPTIILKTTKSTAVQLQRCLFVLSVIFIGHYRNHVQLSESGGKWRHSQPSHSFFNSLLQTGWNMHELQIPHQRVLIFAINQ